MKPRESEIALSESADTSQQHKPLIVWQILDDRPGHRNQVLGLTEALQRVTPVKAIPVPITTDMRGLRSLLPGCFEQLQSLEAPELLIAAGHATHLPTIRLQRRFGGRSVVLMKPSLPMRWFDLCLIPDTHSFRNRPDNVALTQGAINRIRPSTMLDPGQGMLLVGGPSSHFGWSDEKVIDQATAILTRHPHIDWTVATSRRTPDSFISNWRTGDFASQIVTASETSLDWLPTQLTRSAMVWVTADSVSMLYEALTAGAAVGLLELPAGRQTRVARAVSALIAKRQVVPFSNWNTGSALHSHPKQLCEADRCAELVLTELFESHRLDAFAA